MKVTRRAVLGGAAGVLASGVPTWAAAPAFSSRRISIAVRGSGPDVLLIPGLATGAGIWNSTIAAVPGYRYHLVQLRGFGGLAADANKSGPLIQPVVAEIARYIGAAGLSRPAAVGHSMGGTLAMMLALRSAPAIGRLMVVDMLPEGAGMVGGTASGMGYLADQIGGYFTGTKAGRQLFADMVARQPGAKGSDPEVIATALTEMAHVDLGPQLARMPAPFRILYAVPGDAQGRQAQTQRYRTAYAPAKQAMLQPIGPSGHMIMQDQPAQFAAALRTFLKG